MKHRILTSSFLLVLLFIINTIQAQVTTDPAIPLADQAVTLTLNTTGTGLEGYSGIIYAHTGVTVNGNQWQNVIGDWGNNTNQPQLTNLGNNTYELVMEPSIRDFYGVAPSDVISELDLVFRSDDGSQQTSPDIFIEVFESGLNISLISPSTTPYFVDPAENIEVIAEATEAVTVYLYVDDQLISMNAGNSINESIVAENTPDTKHWIKVVAENTTTTATDSTYYYIRGEGIIEDQPAETVDGINYIDNSTATLVLRAPYKSSVYVIGDFNDWQVDPEYKLKRTSLDANDFETRYWVTLAGLTPGEEYAFQYLIDENLRVADAYTDKVLDKWNDPWIDASTYPNLKPYPENKTDGIVSVLETGQEPYNWQTTGYTTPPVENILTYELLIRDFLDAHDFKTLKDTIPYLKKLGITAVELMPVSEFEGNLSWGYNPSFYFAPDKYYGPKDDMKAFVDACHANGMAVIMDMVLNHSFGQNVMAQMYWDNTNNRPAANNPWFNVESPNPTYNWGSDFNHESQATKDFVDHVNRYWMDEYKIDGFRFDFTKGFTNTPGEGWNYDAPRIAILKRMADSIWADKPEAYVILEHFTENSEEKELADYGMVIWGNINYNYNEATMGWLTNSDFSSVSYKSRSYNQPHLMGYMESHDEERLMAKNINYGNASSPYNVQDTTTALKRMELAAAFFIPIPGPKMIWQFGEMGYDYYINYPGEIGGSDHRVDNKPIRWNYLDDSRRHSVYHKFASLAKLKQEEPAFSTTDFNMTVSGAMKKIHLNHSDMNVTILGNFDVTSGTVNPNFQETGYWHDYFGGDSINVENVTTPIELAPGEYRVYTDKKLEYPWSGVGVNSNAVARNDQVRVFPNPASQRVNIEVNLQQNSTIQVSIYDLRGQFIQSLSNDQLYSGKQIFIWNAKNEAGHRVSPGLYIVKVNATDFVAVQKILIN